MFTFNYLKCLLRKKTNSMIKKTQSVKCIKINSEYFITLLSLNNREMKIHRTKIDYIISFCVKSSPAAIFVKFACLEMILHRMLMLAFRPGRLFDASFALLLKFAAQSKRQIVNQFDDAQQRYSHE